MSDKHDVRRGKEIEFADGKERLVKPLTIRQLRKFITVMDKMQNMEPAAMGDDDIEVMVEAAQIILSKVDPELAADAEAIEDAVDIVIFGDMMDIAMGTSSPEA